MKDNFKLGAALAVIGIIVGLVAFYQFATIYNPMIKVELDAGRPDEAFVVRYVFPILGYLAITAGVLWMLALYGFIIQEKWAWMLGLIGSTLSLLAGFFPMIPAMSRPSPPPCSFPAWSCGSACSLSAGRTGKSARSPLPVGWLTSCRSWMAWRRLTRFSSALGRMRSMECT